MEAKGKMKVIQFTVLNVREKGWLRAPWYACLLFLSVALVFAYYLRLVPPGKSRRRVRRWSRA